MEEKKLPTIRFDPAYSGGLLNLNPAQWPLPTVFDIDGLEERPQVVPIVRDHDQNKKVGQTTRINYDGGKITAEGVVINFGIDPDAGKVVELANRGAALQASVATGFIQNADVEVVPAGSTAQANGQTFEGPCEIVRKWRLKEISIVTIGADDEGTRVYIAQAARDSFEAPRESIGGTMKKFNWSSLFKGLGMSEGAAKAAAARVGKAADGPTAEDVLKEIEKNGEPVDEKHKAALCAFAEEIGAGDPEKMDDDELKVLEAAFAKFGKAEDEPEPAKEDEEHKAALCAFAAEIGAGDPEKMDDEELKVLEAAFAKFGKAEGEPEPAKEDEETKAAAASRGSRSPRSGAAAWSRTKYPTAELGKYTKTVWKGTARPTASRVAEASLFTANGTDGKTLERLGYSKEEIDEAQRVENRTLSLRGLIYRTGEAQPGYCDEGKIADVMRKAQYLAQREEYEPGRRVARAAGELSTVDIPNVLANVINKSMLNGVQMVDDPTDTISRVVAARDFRPQYFINLLASGEFADVKANGEVENLALSDTRYENAAKMRGMEVRIGYETIANDDMNAIQEIPKIMGRKAGLRKQKIFFEAFTAAAAASAPNNLPGVASNPALNLAGLDKGCAAFRGLKDDDADPIGARPKFLIVPPALEGTALNLITASEIVSGSTGDATGLAIVPNIKRYAARFEVVTSEYLGATGPFASNWGDKKWMLLADPIDVPLMILSYYQNQKTPTIKTVYGDTEIDGLRYVLYWGVGVSVAEKKSCVVSNPS